MFSFLFTILLLYILYIAVKWLLVPLFFVKRNQKKYEQQYNNQNTKHYTNNSQRYSNNTDEADGTIPDDFGEYTDYEELE